MVRPGASRAIADERDISSALLLALTGDAGQRAIAAQAMGWKPAQAASGTDWMLPHLAQLLDDPYDAVRFIAGRSLRTLPEFRSFEYDFAAAARPPARRAAPRDDRLRARRAAACRARAIRGCCSRLTRDVNVPATLALLKQRNNRNMLLRE